MRRIIGLCVCMLAVPVFAVDEDKPVEVREVVVHVSGDETTVGGEDHVVRVDATVDGEPVDGEGVIVVNTVTETGTDGANTTESKYHVVTRVARAGDANRGWLGVALAELKGEKAQSSGADHGVVVLNVVKDSPAEIAGLLENDIITAINGTPVTDGVADLARKIGEMGPDAVAHMTVVRDGEELQLDATLASPKSGRVEWMYAPDFNFNATEKIKTLPGVYKLTPDGDVRFFGPDDLPNLQNLPQSMLKLIAPMNTTTQLSFEDGEQTLKMINNEDGNVLEITQEGDGPIVVKRYVEGAEEDATEVECATPEELEAVAPDAFKIYNQHGRSSVWFGDDGATFQFLPQAQGLSSFPDDDIRQRIEESMRSLEEAMQGANGALDLAGRTAFFQTKATRSFKVNADGEIELTIRKGENEVTRVYVDEADLQARNPEAYDRYVDVISADVDE